MGRKPWTGPWVATFKDGPYKGHTRWWAVGPVWNEIVLAPVATDSSRSFICGGDGIPPVENEAVEPWPYESPYRLTGTKRAKYGDQVTMIANYHLVRQATR